MSCSAACAKKLAKLCFEFSVVPYYVMHCLVVFGFARPMPERLVLLSDSQQRARVAQFAATQHQLAAAANWREEDQQLSVDLPKATRKPDFSTNSEFQSCKACCPLNPIYFQSNN